jgi:hypothetical protein
MKVLFAFVLSVTLVAGREVVNFDFAWRFTQGNEPRYEQCKYEKDRNIGANYIWTGGTATKEECCNECANRDTCRAWDWNGRLCWVKDNTNGNKSDANHWSGVVAPWPTDNSTVPARAELGYDDSAWEAVDAPHDMGRGREMRCTRTGRRLLAAGDGPIHAYNNCSGWYRKHFTLPSAWKDGTTYVYFEGVYHNSVLWLNGKRLGVHINGYTSFWYRLDGAAGATFGETNENVLTIFANAAPGAGYWYQGGGLTRHQSLVHTSAAVFLPPDTAWAHTNMSQSTSKPKGDLPAAGMTATNVKLVAEGVVRNGGTQQATNVYVDIAFVSKPTDGGAAGPIASAVAGPLTIAAGADTAFRVEAMPTAPVELWSVPRPFLYGAQFVVKTAANRSIGSASARPTSSSGTADSGRGSGGGNGGDSGGESGSSVIDESSVTFGIRDVLLDPNKGMLLNGQHVKMRGFCDHSYFGGVGAAVPDRVNLFRAQTIRAVGANAWRMVSLVSITTGAMYRLHRLQPVQCTGMPGICLLFSFFGF